MTKQKKEHSSTLSPQPQTSEAFPEDKSKLKWSMLKPEMLLMGVFILALFIRLVYLNQITASPIFYGLAMDSDKYEQFALEITKGNFTHEDSIFLNSLYPFFLALIYVIFGHSNFSVIVIQGILDSVSCLLIYYIASMLFNKKVGVIAALTYACYGIAVFYTGILLAPTVIIFCTLLFITVLLFAEERRQPQLFIIAGILFGVAVLARPNIIVFLLILPLWIFTSLRNKLGFNKAIQGFLLLLVGFCMVISLSTIRTYSIEKRFSPFSALGGLNFYIGNNAKAKGYFMSPKGITGSPIEQFKTSIRYAEKETGIKLTPSQASRYWLSKGLQFIKDNPNKTLLLYIKKFALLWRKEEVSLNVNYTLSKNFAPIFQAPFFSFGMVVPFSILGILLSQKRNKNSLLIILFIFSYMMSVIIFFVSARYRLPIVPFLIMFAAYALCNCVEMIGAKEIKKATMMGVLFILFFAGINANFKSFAPPLSSTHYNNLGMVYKKQGKFDKAITELKKALSIDSMFGEVHSNLGVLYALKGMLREASSQLQKAISINPDNSKAHNNLGIVYAKQNMLDNAIREYKQALRINPFNADAHFNLGLVYDKKDQLDEAIAEYKSAASINPHDAVIHFYLGLAYDKKGWLDEAIAEYRQALLINPRYVEAQTNLGVAYVNKDMLEEAISCYKKVIDLKPDYAEVHYNLGLTYYYQGNLQLAILHFDKAMSLGHRVPPELVESLRPYR